MPNMLMHLIEILKRQWIRWWRFDRITHPLKIQTNAKCLTLILHNHVVQDYTTCHELSKCLHFPHYCRSMINTLTNLEHSECPLHIFPTAFRLCKETLLCRLGRSKLDKDYLNIRQVPDRESTWRT